MKRLNQIVAMVLMVVISSCSSDDGGDSGSNETSLEGTWKLTAFTTGDPVDYNQDGNATTNLLTETNNCNANDTLDFNSSGTVTAVSSTIDITVDIEVGTTDTLEITLGCLAADNTTTSDWSRNGNTITISSAAGSFSGTVDGDTLTFTVPQGFIITTLENNEEVTTLTDITQVFTKQ